MPKTQHNVFILQTQVSNTLYQKYWQSPIMKINALKKNLYNFYLAYDVKNVTHLVI